MSSHINKLREHVEDIIKKHLPAKNNEKSEFGEVFTPVSMIETLYQQFPKSIWSDHTSKWLDPAGGIGNFTLVLFFWLMEGLKHKFPNQKARAKHIIEKMIYIVEINKSNTDICKKIFNSLSSSAQPNIYEGDFLTLNTDKLNWPDKYTAVIGNPPYNIGGTGLAGSKRTHIIFAENGLKLLEKNGFLAFICPPSYREANTPMNKLFKNGHFVFIKIYGAKETFNLFRIQGRVDSFIFQLNKKGTTTIDDEYGIVSTNVSINLDNHIPNFGFSIFKKLYDKTKQIGHIDAFRNTEMSSVKASTFGCNGRNKILHLIVEKGKRIYKSVKKHSLTNTPKLLINGLGVPYVYYDSRGEYGPSQSPVIVLRPSKNVVNLIDSKFFSFVAWGLRLTGNNNLPYLFNAIPDVSKDKSNNYKTLNDIKKGFNLNNDEIKFIDDHFKLYHYENKDIVESCSQSKQTKKKSQQKNKTRKNKKT